MNQQCMISVVKTLTDYQAYRISPNDTNRLAIIFDPDSANDSLTVCVEIFEVGSKTPPHRHNFAVEMFFILKGEGIAVCDGKETFLHTGDSVLTMNEMNNSHGDNDEQYQPADSNYGEQVLYLCFRCRGMTVTNYGEFCSECKAEDRWNRFYPTIDDE